MFSAFGACVADVQRDVAQTFYHALPAPIAEVNQTFGALAEQALTLVESDGIARESIELTYELDMRIHGQLWEITIPCPAYPAGRGQWQRRGLPSLQE